MILGFWSEDRLSEPSTHPSFYICWLSCAACPVCPVCPVLRVFSAESAFSLCVEWGCVVGVFSSLVPCSPAPSFPLEDNKRRRLSRAASILDSARLSLSLSLLSCLVSVFTSCRPVPFSLCLRFLCVHVVSPAILS